MPDQPPELDALDRVLEVTMLLQEDMTTSLARDGLTPSRAHLLWALGQRGPCTQRVLAEALEVSPRNITGLVDGLAGTGFVTREPHPTDGRAALVSLTKRGQRTVEEMATGQQKLAGQLFGDLTPRRLSGLNRALDDVLARLRQLVAEDKERHRDD